MGLGPAAVGQVTSFQQMVDSTLIDVEFGNAAWGDYDNDGEFELVITGRSLDEEEGPVPITRIFQYIEDRVFSNMGILTYVTYYNEVIELPGLWQSTVAWGDYDNDNDLDLFIAGLQADDTPLAQIYTNEGGTTFNLHADLTGFSSGDVAWGDYDNDGDLDLLAAGIEANSQYRTIIYENQAGTFTRRDVGLTGVGQASVKWGDYDTDGDLDILLAGLEQRQEDVFKVYQNEGMGTFIEIVDNLNGLAFPSVDWGDYDNDGDLDILHSGAKYSPFVLEGTARVYRNDGGGFTRVDERLGVFTGNAVWGDFNADARLDYLAFGGVRPHAFLSGQVQENVGGSFASLAVPYSFAGILFGDADWGDYDGDGDLDFFVIGERTGGLSPVMVYRNDVDVSHTLPGTPTGLQATRQENGDITLSWQAPPGEGLSYNLRVGSTSGDFDIVSPMAMPTGRRLLSARGNAGHNLEWTLRLPQGQYYWSVQAINAAYAGSAFAPEEVFSTGDPNDMTPPAVPTGFMATSGDEQVMLSWEPNTETDFARYLLYRGSTPEAENLLVSLPTDVETYTDTDVQNGETYYYRLQARDAAGNLSALTEAQIAMPSPRFTEANIPGLPTIGNASIAWGDYDNDGDPDLVIGSRTLSAIYRNDDGTLMQVQGLRSLWDFPAMDWGDYDADGDLDLVMAGRIGVSGRDGMAIIYRNDNGTFVQVNVNLPAMADGNVLWADYDTDGDLDLLLAGSLSNGQGVAVLYRNDNGTFVDSGNSFGGIASGGAAWGDYDADGDPDLIISDFTDALDVYRNDGGLFVGVANLTSGFNIKVSWGDYDNDGDLDLLVADLEDSRLYRNDSGTFVDTQSGFPSLVPPNAINANVDVVWGDYDNDGDLDLVFAGSNFTDLYRNTESGFVREESGLAEFNQVDVDWVDFDMDGDLDLLMAGSQILFFQNNAVF